MAVEPQLDAAGGAPKGSVILFLAAVLILGAPAFARDQPSEQARLAAAQKALDAGNWEEATKLARGPADQSPDLDLVIRSEIAVHDPSVACGQLGLNISPHFRWRRSQPVAPELLVQFVDPNSCPGTQ